MSSNINEIIALNAQNVLSSHFTVEIFAMTSEIVPSFSFLSLELKTQMKRRPKKGNKKLSAMNGICKQRRSEWPTEAQN